MVTMFKQKFGITAGLILGFFIISLSLGGFIEINKKMGKSQNFPIEKMVKKSNDSPISINGNSELGTVLSKGNGSSTNPYILENKVINAADSGSCISINNTNAWLIIRNCTVQDSGSAFPDGGMTILNCSNIEIENNSMENNQGCGLISQCNNSIIIDNVVVNNDAGLVLWGKNVSTLDNTVSYNNGDGIYFSQSSNCSITDNLVFRDNEGILISSSTGMVMHDNNVTNTVWSGFIFDNANYCMVYKNICSMSGKYGIDLETTPNSKIYLNKIVNSTWSEAYCTGSTNSSWDNGSLGNYWGDYKNRYPSASIIGPVWNTSYQINTTTSYDRFPLAYNPTSDPFLRPVADFTANITSIIAGQQVKFTFTGLTGINPTSYHWCFYDGSNNASGPSPVHKFSSIGNYSVTLTVKDFYNSTSVKTKVNYIIVSPDLEPIASFLVNASHIIADETIQFTFNGSLGNTPANITWKFGDSQTSSLTNPVHRYTSLGNYTVQLIIIDANGNRSTMSVEIVVSAPLQLPSSFVLTSEASPANSNNSFILNWTSSIRAINYSIYMHSTIITAINSSVTLLKSGLINNSYHVSLSENGTYYFVVVACNDAGNTSSNCIAVVVQITSAPGPQPTPNPWTSLVTIEIIAAVACGFVFVAVVVGVMKKRKRGRKAPNLPKLAQKFGDKKG